MNRPAGNANELDFCVPVAFGGNNQSGPIDVATACNAHGGTGRMDFESETFVAFHKRQDPVSGETVPSIGAKDNGMGVMQKSAVRRLTPRECERLQGFPDDWTLIPWRGKPAADCPDGPRYKAIGNSMAVPVMAWIGKRIASVS